MADTQIRVTVDTRQAQRSLSDLQSTLLNLASIGSVSALARQFVTLTGNMQEMTNKLISVSTSLSDANNKFELLANTSKKTGSNLGGTVDLYQKLAQSSTFAGSSTESLAGIAENFNKTLQISGASGAGAASALYQFAQAMQKGSLNGDEFRTMSETNGFMLKVLEKELGKTSTELRQMASDGQLSAEVIAKALLRSNDIAKEYGKTIRTIPQAFENLDTAVSVAIKRFNDFTGVGNGIARVIDGIASSIPAMIGGLVGIGVALAVLAVRITAVRVALIAMRAAMISTGLGALIVAAGVAAGYLADKMGVFGSNAEDAVDPIKDQNKALQDGLVITHQRTQEALNLDKALKEQIGLLENANSLEMKSTGLKSLQLEGEKALAIEVEKYKKTGEAIDATLATRIVKATQDKILAEERTGVQKQLLDLQSRTNTLGILDAQESKIRLDLEKFRLGVTKETYEARKGEVEQALRAEFAADARNNIEQMLLSNAKEMDILFERNVVKQEQMRAIEQVRKQYGQQIADQYKKQVEETTKELVMAKELANIVNEYADAKNSTIKYQLNMNSMTAIELADFIKIEQINRKIGFSLSEQAITKLKETEEYKRQLEYLKQIKTATDAINTPLNGEAAAAAAAGQLGSLLPEKKILTDRETLMNGLQILLEKERISEADYQSARVNAEMEANAAILAARQNSAEAQMKAQGVTNTAIIDMVKGQMAAVQMIQQGGVVGVQGVFQGLTNALGTMSGTSKKAFEMHKKMAIAQALISTYQAAAMSIALPPGPPFSLIYVASAILAGMAQVAQIKSQQFSGRALGGPVMGGTPYLVGENGPEVFTPTNTGSITRNQDIGGGGEGIAVNFTINAVDATSLDTIIMQRRGLITQIITDAVAERGRRVM